MKTRLIILLLLATFSSFSQNEATFRGSSNRNGVFESEDIAKPTLKWKYRTTGQVYSSPVVDNGTLYVGSNDSYLYAINTADGTLKWRFKTGRRIKSTPCVINEVVYFGSFDSTFYAVNAVTGNELWRFKTGGETTFSANNIFGIKSGGMKCPDPWDFYSSSLIYFDKAVYFGSGDSSIYCLNATTGAMQWSYKTSGIVHSSPAIADNIVYCGSWDSKIYAINAKSGKLIWDFQTGIDTVYNCFVGIQASPVVVDGIVYCGSRDAYLYALDAKTGKVIWKQKDQYSSWLPSFVAVKGDFLYVGSSDALRFYVFNRKSGSAVSEYRTGIYTFSSPAITSKLAYIGSMNGKLYAFDIKTGLPQWIFSTDASLSSLYFSKDGDYLNDNAKDVYEQGTCWEMIKSIEQIVSSAGSILSSPYIADGVLYFTSTDGYIYALENGDSSSDNIEYMNSEKYQANVNANEISFTIAEPTKVSISVLSSDKTSVKSLLKEDKQLGTYTITWDGTDKSNKKVLSGEYLCKFTFGKYVTYCLVKI